MKIALINDVHLGVRNDSHVFLEAHKKFFHEVFFPTLEKEGIKDIVILGDLFDRRKYISFNTLYEVKKWFFDELKARDIVVDILVGNHDVAFKNTNRVNSPNLLLSEYDNIIVHTKPVTVKYGEERIGLIPWINVENEEESFEFINNFDGSILFGHFEINGFEMHRNGGACHDGLEKNIFRNYEMVLSGHFHEQSVQGNVQYLGAPMQFTWADYDCERGFHYLDLDTRELTKVVNPDKMFHKIFYDEDINILEHDYDQYQNRIVRVLVGEKTDQHKFDLFVDNIQRMNPFQLDVVDNTMTHLGEDFDAALVENQDTMSLVSSYIDELEVDFDSDAVKNILRQLYIEALAELD